jgi:hypothetical protein
VTTYQVGQETQNLYPDGQNDAFSIINNGPWTVFLDENASIGPQSYALPPNAVIVWPAHTPLFVRGNDVPQGVKDYVSDVALSVTDYSPSTIVLQRITDAADASRALTTTTIGRYDAGETQAYPFECGTFDSLIVNISKIAGSTSTTPINDDIFPNGASNVNIAWFDAYGNRTYLEQMFLPLQYIGPSGARIPMRAVMKVKDVYCWIYITNDEPASGADRTFSISGTNRDLTPRLDFWTHQASGDERYLPVWLENLTVSSLGAADWCIVQGDYVDFSAPLYMNCVAPAVDIAIRSSGVGTAGSILLLHTARGADIVSPLPGIIELDVPTGSSTVSVENIAMPVTALCQLNKVSIVGGTFNISLRWRF